MLFTFSSSLLLKLLKQGTSLYLSVDPPHTSPQLSAIHCHFSSASACDPSTCFQFTWQCLCPKQFECILGDLVRHCFKSFIKIMLCIFHPGFLQFYQKSNHVSLARHVPYEPMLLIAYRSIILWMFRGVFWGCLEFFSVYFLFLLSNCSVLSHYRICLKLNSLFNKPLFFPLLMFEAILAMLYDFSEIIFEGLVFSLFTEECL